MFQTVAAGSSIASHVMRPGPPADDAQPAAALIGRLIPCAGSLRSAAQRGH